MDLDPRRPRVFGIGLNKTGTTSLTEALQILGINAFHWGGPEIRMRIEKAHEEGRPLLDDLDPALDAFSDIEALSRNYALLDEQYPGSKFILTVRPLDDWLRSRKAHVEHNHVRKAAGEYDGKFLVVDEPRWRRQWERHVDAVRDYFGGRDDFLEIDITAGEGWAPFCELLGVPVPAVDFPAANKARDRRLLGEGS